MASTALAPLLEASGVPWREDEVVELIRGVLAAPEPVDPAAWLDLIAPADAQELRDALQEITSAARSLRVLADYLEQHPESLIRGKSGE